MHGKAETHGFVPMLAAVARAKCISAYVGYSANLWPAVYRQDAALVYRLALERGSCGQAYHSVAEEGVRFRAIAEAIGRQLGLPAQPLSPADAEVHFGPLATWVAHNGPASNAWAMKTLGWTAEQVGIVADVAGRRFGECRPALLGRLAIRPGRSDPRS